MRQINEQWVEEFDGKKHMLKAVDSTYNCNGCTFLSDSGKCLHSSIFECPVYRIDAIIKDLGPVNEDGLLPCPFCGEYPKIGNFGDGFSDITFYVKHDKSECVICGLMRTKSFKTKQEAIDAWNRRN